MLAILISFLIFISSFNNSYAYTTQDVSAHSTSTDCWIIFEGNVYDITRYIKAHDEYLNIRSWCGTDITQAFATKNNTGSDHKSSTYSLLASYKIGSLEAAPTETNPQVVDNSVPPTEELTYEENKNNNENVENVSDEKSNPYNVIVPLLLSTSLYWIPYIIIKNKKNPILLKKFNGFWNSLLILLLLFPAFGFGIFMILRYQFLNLWNIKFDFMYWHVELSVAMGILAINHFLQRIRLYFFQLKN